MSKVIVCGGRDFSDRKYLFACLDRFHKKHSITCVVNGAAKGADSLSTEWAEEQDIEVREYPANWKKHGRAAGPIRNQQMIDEESPDFVLAFKGGNGTKNMMTRAKMHGIKVVYHNCKE